MITLARSSIFIHSFNWQISKISISFNWKVSLVLFKVCINSIRPEHNGTILPNIWCCSVINAIICAIHSCYIHDICCWLLAAPNPLTHWGRVTHICVSKQISIGSDNGSSPGWRQAIIWTNAGILLIKPLGTNFSEILIEIHTFSFKKIHLKMSSGKWRPFCLGLNVLIQ